MKFFDTACSMSMSGVRDVAGFPGRLEGVEVCEMEVKGFDGGVRESGVIGVNEDGKKELYVEGMPKDLVLLCAKHYAEEGAAILFGEGGMVLRLSEEEKDKLKEQVMNYDVTKYLEVNNSTYRVAEKKVEQEALAAANTYFNTKVNVSNGEERVLASMLSPLSM